MALTDDINFLQMLVTQESKVAEKFARIVCIIIDCITILPEMIRNACEHECEISPRELVLAYHRNDKDAAEAVKDAMTNFMKTDAGKEFLDNQADVANLERAIDYENSDSYTGDYEGR